MKAPAKTTNSSSLDEAWGLVLSGDRDEALRRCVAMLESDPLQLGAASLALELLAAEEREGLFEIAGRLVDAYVRRSDLPAATAAAASAAKAGSDAAVLRKTIAAAFGKGGERLADVAPAPPPLPVPAVIERALAEAKGDALAARAVAALEAFASAEDPVAAGGKVSQLPLFSALRPEPLEQLLAGFALRSLRAGEEAIAQGDEGREAFVVVRGTLRAERRASEDAEPETLAVLGPGAIFGEMALVSEAPRAASVVAVEPSQLLVADRDVLEKLAQKEPAIGSELALFCRRRMMANLLRHGAILAAVAPEQRDELVARFQSRDFAPGDVLVTQGEEPDGLYLVASGRVRVTGTDADGDKILLAELGPGDVVGEIGLVLRRPATATVTASHPTIALHLARDRFQEAIREHPTLLSELYELATKREEETRSVVAQEALDAEDVVLV